MGENRKENVSTFLHISWEKGRVNLIILPDRSDGMNKILKHFPSGYMTQNISYIQRYLMLFQCKEKMGEINDKHLLA